MKWIFTLLLAIAIASSAYARFSTPERGVQKPMWPENCYLAGHLRPNMVMSNGYCYYKPVCPLGYEFVESVGQCRPESYYND